MRRIMVLGTAAGRRLAADGRPLIGSRYAKVLVLSATVTAVIAVGLLAFATSARADVACTGTACWEKTATPDRVVVGEPLTFTITGFCGSEVPGCVVSNQFGFTDTLPAGIEFVSATATGYGGTDGAIPQPTCSESEGTVTCAPVSFIGDPDLGLETPFVATI